MKRFLVLLVALGIGGTALADTGSVTFDKPTYCSTYCDGYTTYSSEHTVNYVTDDVAQSPNVMKLTVGFDGVRYSGLAIETPITPVSADYYASITNALLTSADGTTSITVSVVVHVKRTAVSSGRAHYTITRHWVQSGSVTF